MIVVWGALDDSPVAGVLAALQERDADVVHIGRDDLASMRYDVTVDGRARGWIETSGRRIGLDTVDAIYLRPEPARGPSAAGACLLAIAGALDAVVVNRPASGRSNLIKPFQLAAIAAAGLRVPATLVTTDPAAARRFLARHGRIAYKSISGIRSIVSALDPSDVSRLDAVCAGPVQLQQWIGGLDVRVHVVGTRWFATSIESEAIDYRYGARSGHEPTIAASEIDRTLGEQLVALAAGMGLLVAGIDLRQTPEDDWYCFEVNPSPGFTFYEEATGQPIAAAIADLLLAGRP